MSSIKANIPVLHLTGRFDAHEVKPVADWMQEQVDANRPRLVVDLQKVNFIDSTALSTLVRGLKHCREQGGDLHLCSLQQPVRVIFELTRLDKAFDIFASEQEAIQAFTG
ncbi:MAG: STAS domain-containing protein [Chloroflexi bacterium]|nr:STAS domain-containing protein [Chloroflexota bacterium]